MSGQGSQDAKFFQRGKIQVRSPSRVLSPPAHCACQEFRAELQAAESKDKKFTKRKTVLKKIVANITMGNDSESYCARSVLPVSICRLQCPRCSVMSYNV